MAFTLYISVIRNNFTSSFLQSMQSFKIYNVYSHFIHIKTKWGLLHLKPVSSLSVKKKRQSEHIPLCITFNFKKRVQLACCWATFRSAILCLHRVTRQQKRREVLSLGKSVSFFPLFSINTWFNFLPHPVRTCPVSKCGQVNRSVSVHMTGVGSLLLRCMIQP